jgi:hypothetical protein
MRSVGGPGVGGAWRKLPHFPPLGSHEQQGRKTEKGKDEK